MAKDASLVSSLSKATEEELIFAYDYALINFGRGRFEFKNGLIIDVYHVPILSDCLFYVLQLITHTSQKVEFLPNRFVVMILKITL
jgi:hypothetical protein